MNLLLEMLRMWRDGEVPCLFHEFTGLYCPGCGGTRAVKSLLHGNLILSFLYHPLVIYCGLVAVWFAVNYLIYWRTKNPKYRLFLDTNYIYVGVAVTAVNFFVKNFFLMAKGIDLLEALPKV